MAGFFGFFNKYDKEGPGIAKDAPKKKTFVVFFESYFRNFWKFILINVVYTVLCVPVLTHGMACAGITNVTRNIARDKHSFGISDFFETIRKNLKQSLAVGVINSIITVLIGFAVYFYYASYAETASLISAAGLAVALCVAVVFYMMNFYIYTLMITFNYKLKLLYVNSFKFVIINLKKNILCALLQFLVFGIYAIILYFSLPFIELLTLELLLAILFFPAFIFLMQQYFTFPAIKKHIIDPYYAEHPDADIEKRRDLGLEVEEKEEATFSDERILPSEEN